MKFFKKTIISALAVLAFGGSALAGTVTVTGTAYTMADFSGTPTSDGNNLVKYTNQAIWTFEGMPEGFPSAVRGDCQGVGLSNAQWANTGEAFICIATDIDGDGYVNVGGSSNPDYSDCHYKRVAAWGKWAGSTESGKCYPVGQATQSDFMMGWTSQITFPD